MIAVCRRVAGGRDEHVGRGQVVEGAKKAWAPRRNGYGTYSIPNRGSADGIRSVNPI
jgi:hypothetical protein